jgi:glycosyltransferase involved in cell wall biosynthesis
VRVAVHTDYVYRKDGGDVFAERAFALFLARLADSLEGMVLVGRLDPDPGRSHYRLPKTLGFVPLPHYPSLLHPAKAIVATLRSVRRLWRTLDGVDSVWLLGPYLVGLVFLVLAALRGKKIVLGVRQDLPRYVRSRHPDRRWTHLAAFVLDLAYRLLARRYPVVVVGPELARHYRAAPRLLTISVSLIEESSIVTPEMARARLYDGELKVLSVGRIEREKNPLLLAEVLALLVEGDRRWRLVICGEGPMDRELDERLRALGVREHAELRGYVPIDRELPELYRSSHFLLHVSWTEGLPAVLFEAFAAGLPVVATAVGGVPDGVGDAALLVPPGDAAAAAAELERLVSDDSVRNRLIEAGIARAYGHTVEAECRRVAEFLAGGKAGPPR